MNWYDVLEVSPHASPQVIRAAYKSLMQRHHPDKTPQTPQQHETLRATQLAQAYAVLSDEVQRQAYDRQLQRQASPASVRLSVPARVPKTTPSRWWGWCLLAVVVGMAGLLLKGRSVPPTVPLAEGGAASAVGTLPRHVRLPGLQLEVYASSPALAGERHRLEIPSVELELGPWQAEQAAWRLSQAASTEALRTALAGLSYEALIAPEGERTLTRTLHDAANQVLGPATSAPLHSDVTAVYGVQAVRLPQSFSLR